MKILSGKDLEDIYNKNKEAIIRIQREQDARKMPTLKDMVFRYRDLEGRAYYGFSADQHMPLQRFGKMKDYLMWMTSSISPDELITLVREGSRILEEGIKHPSRAARIGLILSEIENRANMTLHTELLMNYLAVQWAREDESPEFFNNQIQLEKVDMFKKELSEGDGRFFFQCEELKNLWSRWKMSESEFQASWRESLQEQKNMNLIIQMISSSVEEYAAAAQILKKD
ncbi:MAG: hypothetical protein DWQ44_08925 [Bacteroidetes bacterium]|nr:MAG: hypothetical protein DWQ33_02850 [Bacteroidota bacterium]REK06412.1 MAG: hypothetical protein DWQ39_02715 [Bacteroidota bacterium]REK33178.1 MAG: hypothetical protein DWQ44_08925 [Bacteroidota bacterium]REK47014.1 MAG: hypothetical protein DWQ48_13255 [Bacteroidota bacterium]